MLKLIWVEIYKDIWDVKKCYFWMFMSCYYKNMLVYGLYKQFKFCIKFCEIYKENKRGMIFRFLRILMFLMLYKYISLVNDCFCLNNIDNWKINGSN